MLIQYLVLIFTSSHWKPHVTKKRKERVRGVSMKYIPCQAAGSERTLPWYVDRWMDSPGYGVQRRPGSLLDGRRRSLSSPRRKNRVSLTFDSRNMPASSIIIIHTIPCHTTLHSFTHSHCLYLPEQRGIWDSCYPGRVSLPTC